MFTNLKNRIYAEAAEAKKNARFFIENGYCENWHEENKKHSDEGIKRYCTAARWDAYQAGKISREKIVDLTIKRMEKQEDKRTCERLEKVYQAAAAPDLENVSISVEWKRNATWGYNPTATVTIYAGGQWTQYTGTASGCGYDKRSAAVGAALNKSASIKKMLYTAKEKALMSMEPEKIEAAKKGYVFGSESNRDFIHYGAGYGVLPYFEGGVGIIEFYGVFRVCGYEIKNQHETKYSDYYYFEKVEG
jgi:hypothetical protein